MSCELTMRWAWGDFSRVSPGSGTLTSGILASRHPRDVWPKDASGRVKLAGTVAAGRSVTVTLAPPTMPLNKDGDEVLLIDPAGVVRFRVEYTSQLVQIGTWVVGP